MPNCPMCGAKVSESNTLRVAQSDSTFFECRFCGRYSIFDELKRKPFDIHIVAGFLYEFNRGRRDNGFERLTAERVDEILEDSRIPHSPVKKLERFLLNLYNVNDQIGIKYQAKENNTIEAFYQAIQTRDAKCDKRFPLSIAYSRSWSEVDTMLAELASLGYTKQSVMVNQNLYHITARGFERAETLLTTNLESRKVFVAMQFSKPNVMAELQYAIKPACEACGFEAFITSDNEYNSGIIDEIISQIRQSKFVIADLTYANNGAYYEAGYSTALGREVIHCCKESWLMERGADGVLRNKLHFDVAHLNVIIWKDADDLRERLVKRIRAIIPDARFE